MVFAILSEGREPDSSSSIFVFQDYFGYLESLVFPYNYKIVCSSSVKDVSDNLIDIALNLRLPL